MIQRIQSVYLFSAAILCILMFAFDIWQAYITTSPAAANAVETTVILDVFALVQYENGQREVLQNTWWLAAISGLVGAIALSAIFLYGNRMLQLRLSRLCIFLLTVQIALIFFHIYEAKDIIAKGHTEFYDASVYFPIGALVFFFLSGRGIMKDERMVRAADRLR